MTNLPFCGLINPSRLYAGRGLTLAVGGCTPVEEPSRGVFRIELGDRVERFGMHDYYVEAHKSIANLYEVSKLSILRGIQKFMLQITHYGRSCARE